MFDENEADVSEEADAQTEEEEASQGSETKQEVAPVRELPVDMYYDYEKLVSKATISPESDIPHNLLQLSHSFGYDCKRRSNLQLLDEQTLAYIAGNFLVLQDMVSKKQTYLRSFSGGGIGAIIAHPDKDYFAVGEKGKHPNIIIYEYPSLRPYRILRGGTEHAYSCLDFSGDGKLLASVGGTPDYMLTLWDWRQEEVMLSCKAVSQDVYKVSFSPHNPGLLTSSGLGHIKFWKMVNTFTGLKPQGLMGHFGKTAATDIESYVVLPDGKVVSGSDWGNLLLWDGNTIKVEICRKEGQTCHAGTVLPFALEEGQLMTIGSDGAVRGWDFESIDGANSQRESNNFEMEPTNELVIGHNVCLTSLVKSSLPDSFIWFAQDAMGAIWKLDLSFTHTTPDPECLFLFHCGAIQGMDVSRKSHLMATTALDRSVKVFDFMSKKQLTSRRFTQGGTSLCWDPPVVNRGGGQLVVGFEDGVVRILDVYDPQRLQTVTGRSRKGDAELRLRQAIKPHSTRVTAVAYERNGEILATASSDCTVFFFSAGEKYSPIGFIHVPGPVQALEWSPHSHSENRLLVLCQNGHVIEVQSSDLDTSNQSQTFQLSAAKTRTFRFKSIKSRIKRQEEIARRQAVKEKKRKESEERCKQSKNPEKPEPEEDEEELPRIFLPNPPSPLYCGFYSQPGRFWLSMGGYDSGFLYHCEFSEKQEVDPTQHQDEPFKALPVHNTDDDPIRSITFSSDRRLLLCGMNSGSIRVYPLQPADHNLESMHHYWTLSVHDNNCGPLRHLHCSHDDQFILTAGDDGNIFSFGLLPPKELPQTTKRAKVPSPQIGLENEEVAQDIEDPSAYSIETAKQKLESDRLRREAELKILAKRKILDDLKKRFKLLLIDNQSLPEHVRLQPEELQLDLRFSEQTEQLKFQKVKEVRKQLAWEQERSHLAFNKLDSWFKDSLDSNVVTVVAIRSDHRVSTYRVPTLLEKLPNLRRQNQSSSTTNSINAELRKIRSDAFRDTSVIKEEEVLRAPPLVTRPARVKLADRQVERLRKAAEKAEQARAKIEKRKEEWAKLYAEKPDENFEDPQDVLAIFSGQETIGDLKLKSAKDFTVPKHLRMNAEQKRDELTALEEKIRERQTEMNARIIALRDLKVELVARLRAQTQQLHQTQRRLPVDHRLPCPTLPCIWPEETPEKRLCFNRTTLLKYKELRDKWPREVEQEDQDQDRDERLDFLQQLEKELKGKIKGEAEGQKTRSQSEAAEESRSEPEAEIEAERLVEKTELEEELEMEERVRLLYQQDSILKQMESAVCEFDAELLMLRHQKQHLDYELKLADLRQLTLYQELLLLKDFERREDSLQEKLNIEAREENCITSKLEELNEQLEAKRQDITKVQEREKALTAAFLTSLGENNKFEEFLTRVFKKKIKRVKKKERPAEEAEHGEESDEDSDEDVDWTNDGNVDEGGAPLDDSVCPQNCDPALFENTLQLRERRLDLEEQLLEEKKSAEALEKDCKMLAKKEKTVKSSRKAVEDDLEVMHREKQQKMNELDVVVPLRLHQIDISALPAMASDPSALLVLDRKELSRLQERIQELQQEKSQQKELYRQARQQHDKLLLECRDMDTKIQVLKKQCDDMMMKKFGRLVDLEALQTLSGNRVLAELKQEKLLKEAAYAKEIHQWDRKVLEAREALMGTTKRNTEVMANMNRLFNKKKELEHKISLRQKKMGKQSEDSHRDQEDIRQLQELVKAQSQQAKALRHEIELLSRKGGHILPPPYNDR